MFTEQLGVGTATISVFGTRFLPIATSVFVERSAVFSIRCIEKYNTRFLEIKHNFENEWGQIRNSFVERHMKKEHGVLKKKLLLIITKIWCCGAKFCHEHHSGVVDPA